MATSNELLNSLNNIGGEIEELKDAILVSNIHLENINKMLTMLNMSSARNARANDLSWKLSATTEQMNIIKQNQNTLQQEESNIQPLPIS